MVCAVWCLAYRQLETESGLAPTFARDILVPLKLHQPFCCLSWPYLAGPSGCYDFSARSVLAPLTMVLGKVEEESPRPWQIRPRIPSHKVTVTAVPLRCRQAEACHYRNFEIIRIKEFTYLLKLMFSNQEMFYITIRKTFNSAMTTVIITFNSFNKLITFDDII